MHLLDRLLAVQLLAAAVAFLGEFVASDLLVATGVAAFFIALAAMFLQMTGALLAGLRRSAGHERLR